MIQPSSGVALKYPSVTSVYIEFSNISMVSSLEAFSSKVFEYLASIPSAQEIVICGIGIAGLGFSTNKA